MSRLRANRRAVRVSAVLTAALLVVTACHSGSSAIPVMSSAGSSGAGDQSSTARSDAGSSSALATPESSTGEKGSSDSSATSTGSSVAPAGGDAEWDGAWGGKAQEPQTHSANDTVPLTFTVRGGKITDFVVDLWPGTCGTTAGDPAYVTDAPIVNGKVDKTTVVGGKEESTTRVVGFFAGDSAYGTVFYVMPGVCDSTQWTWKATRTAGPGALSSESGPQSDAQPGESSAQPTESSTDNGSSASSAVGSGGAAISGTTWTATVPPGWSTESAQQGDDADLRSTDGESAISISAGQPTQSTDTVDSLGAAAVQQLQSGGFTMIQQPQAGTWAGQPGFLLTAGNGSTGTDIEVVGAVFESQEIVITYAVRGSITATTRATSTLQTLESSWQWNQ